MTRRTHQRYDEQSWRYVVVPAVIWTVGVVGACVVGMTSNEDQLAVTDPHRSSRALPPAQAASTPRHALDQPISHTTGS